MGDRVQPFIPSTGSEGAIFQRGLCDRCFSDHEAHIDVYEANDCAILMRSLVLGEPQAEWWTDGHGSYGCDAFKLCDGCTAEGRQTMSDDMKSLILIAAVLAILYLGVLVAAQTELG